MDNATKDPNFINGYFTSPGEPVAYEKPNGDEPAKTDPDESLVVKVTEEKAADVASVVSVP